MFKLDHAQLQLYCQTNGLTIQECANLIGVSTQTIYNAIEGKPLKPETLRKISAWLQLQNRPQSELSINKGREALENAFHKYRDTLQKEWQRNLPKMNYADQMTVLESMRQLDLQFEQLTRYHDVFLKLLSDNSQRQSS